MDSLAFAIGIAVFAVCAGVLGLKLRDWLPERHAPDRAREMIGPMTGLLGLLLALVLGALVGSSYTLYATQKAEIETLAARARQLDSAKRNPRATACTKWSSRVSTRSRAEKRRISAT
jgi:hypothetical protein